MIITAIVPIYSDFFLQKGGHIADDIQEVLFMGRSKKAIQEALDLFNKAMSGDADACIKIWEIMQDDEIETNGGAKDGKDKQRENCRKKSKRG